jgi:hypothetical protein
MILRRLIGRIQFPGFGASLGLGNAGEPVVSGIMTTLFGYFAMSLAR